MTSEKKIDSLIIGYNEPDFIEYESMTEYINKEAYSELLMNCIDYNGENIPPMDLINLLRSDGNSKKHTIHSCEPFSLTNAYLTNYLTKNGLSIDSINLFHLQKKEINNILDCCKSVVVTTTFYITPFPIIEIIEYIRKINKDVQIIVGGPYVNNLLTGTDKDYIISVLEDIDADIYINNPLGENTLLRVINALVSESNFNDIPNLIYRDKNTYSFNPTEKEDININKETIDWSIFPSEKLSRTSFVRSSIGCAFSCSFCSYPLRVEKFDQMDLKSLETELDTLINERDIRSIAFIDDTFNIPLNRFKEICRLLKTRYQVEWYAYIRCQYIDSEIVGLMKESGCKGAFLGIESGDQRILDYMNKKSKIEDYERGIRLLKEAGIVTFASFLTGFPGETEESVKNTINFIKKTSPDFYRTQIWYYDPNTPIGEKKGEFNIVGSGGYTWSHNTCDSSKASEWVYQMFSEINESIWLPMYHFDFWSIPILAEHGMNVEKLKMFLISFNKMIKNRFSPLHKTEVEKSLSDMKDVCLSF